MYELPKAVLERFLDCGHADFKRWGLTPEGVRLLHETKPQESNLYAPVIEVLLPTVGHTVAALRHLLHSSGNHQVHDPLWERRRVKPIFHSPAAPLVRWKLIDLAHHVSDPTVDMCLSRNETWASVLAAAVYHPQWLDTQEGGRVVIPGCRLVTERWQAVPIERPDGTTYHQWGYSMPTNSIASLRVSQGVIHVEPFDERSLVFGAIIPRVISAP